MEKIKIFIEKIKIFIEKIKICIEKIIKMGLGISRMNAESQWNPVYNAFHQTFG